MEYNEIEEYYYAGVNQNILGITTILGLFYSSVNKYGNNEYLGDIINDKPEYITYRQVYDRSVFLAEYLKEISNNDSKRFNKKEKITESQRIFKNTQKRFVETQKMMENKLFSNKEDDQNGNSHNQDNKTDSRFQNHDNNQDNQYETQEDKNDCMIRDDQINNQKNSKFKNQEDDQENKKDYVIGEIIGIFSDNRKEFIITELATYISLGTTCPLYSTLGFESIKHILNQTQMRICFLSKKNCKTFINVLKNMDKIYIKFVIFYEEIDDESFKEIFKMGITIRYYRSILINFGRKFKYKNNQKKEIISKDLSPDHVATICYTSGTTSLPKGAILTHSNFIAALNSLLSFDDILNKNQKHVHISYLPLAHIFERINCLFIMALGNKLCFYSGDKSRFLKDIEIIKPTIFIGVPRIYEKIYLNIKSKVEESNFFKKNIFKKYFNFKKNNNRFYLSIINNSLFDYFIFKEIRNKFGNVCGFLSGSAPLNPEIKEYLEIIFGVNFYEGFGMTELTAIGFLETRKIRRPGFVGIPLPSVKVKFEENDNKSDDEIVIENGELKENDNKSEGEILIKGPTVFKGYFKNDYETRKVFTSDNWFKTGDIGEIKDGMIKIKGRKNDTFKLPNGEFIIPEKIESLLKNSIIENILIFGKPTKNELIGIIFYNKNKYDEDFIKKEFDFLVENVKKRNELNSFEIPKKFIYKDVKFLDNYFTPTFKIMRKKVYEECESELLF